jgi:phosphonate transport system substrate-binding protein
MPEFFFRQNTGKSPDELFSRVGFSGDHSRTVQLVQSGAYEAGVLDYSCGKRRGGPARWTTPRSR